MAKEKKINVIGMDVFQTAAVKRNYQNVKPLIKQRNKLEEKIQELSKELTIKKSQIEANDQHTMMITKDTCGFALTSEQTIWFLDHPDEFESFKAAHNVAGDDNGEGADAETIVPPSTEDQPGSDYDKDAEEAAEEDNNETPFE